MNYKKIYEALCNSRQLLRLSKPDSLNYETHHIIPRCMGGTNDKINLVHLSHREHFLAHRLLSKIYPENHDLHRAIWLMAYTKNGLKINSRTFQILRSNFIKAQSREFSDEHKQKISEALRGENNARFGKPGTFTGKTHTEEVRKRLSQSRENYKGEAHPCYGKKLSEETKEKISKANIGKIAYNKGQKMSEENKAKLSKAKRKFIYFTPAGEFSTSYLAATANNTNQKSLLRWVNNPNKPDYYRLPINQSN